MGDLHQVIVDHVGEVIGGHAVAFDEDLVVKHLVLDGDAAEDEVVEGADSLLVDLLANDVGLAVGEVLFHHRFGEVAAAAVVAGGGALLVAVVLFGLVAEAVVGRAAPDQLLGVGEVDRFAFALDVGTEIAADVRAFIVRKARLFEGAVNHLDRVFDIAVAVGVLDPQDEFPALRLRQQEGIEGGAEVAHVHEAGRARGETGSDGLCVAHDSKIHYRCGVVD